MHNLKDRIREIGLNLMITKTRLEFLEYLEKLLSKEAVDDLIFPRNDIVYMLASDSYQMLVIDLASFCRGLMQKGGFVNQLNNHLAELRPKRKPGPSGDLDADYLAREDHRANNAARSRLFPNAPNGEVSQADVGALKNRVGTLGERAKALRDSVHAHRYEGREDLSQSRFLSLTEIRAVFEALEQILNDINLLLLNQTVLYDALSDAYPDETAKDIRDLILHGSVNSFFLKLGFKDDLQERPLYWKRRDDFYTSPEWAAEKAGWFSD